MLRLIQFYKGRNEYGYYKKIKRWASKNCFYIKQTYNTKQLLTLGKGIKFFNTFTFGFFVETPLYQPITKHIKDIKIILFKNTYCCHFL